MKITKAIAQLQKVLAEEGDLEMFDDEGHAAEQFAPADASDHGFPKEWNIPSRFLYVRVDK
jgi:hypothetical protein